MKHSKWVMRIVIVLLFSGCLIQLGAQNKSGTPIDIRFSWWGGDARHKATLKAIELYMKLNPNVKIQAEYSGAEGYLDKIKIQLASRTAPDVMQIDQTWIEELIAKGDFFADLTKCREIDAAAFDSKFLKQFCIHNGKLLGLPTGVNAQVVLVNKTAATKMGVDIKNLSDWDTLLAEGKKLRAKNKSYYLLAHDTGSFAGEVLMGMVKQMVGGSSIGKDYSIRFGKAELLKAFTWLIDAVKSGLLQPPGDAALYNTKGEQNPKWVNGQVIAVVEWTSNYTRYLNKDAEYAMVLPPIIKNTKDGASTIRPSQEICINAKSPNIAEAVKFLNWFLNDKEAAVILGDVRSIPVSGPARKAATEAGKINKMTSDAVGEATKSPKSLEDLGYNRQLVEILLDVVMKVEFGALTPEKGVEEYFKRTTNKLSELKAAAR